jgi:hypothetical protein
LIGFTHKIDQIDKKNLMKEHTSFGTFFETNEKDFFFRKRDCSINAFLFVSQKALKTEAP